MRRSARRRSCLGKHRRHILRCDSYTAMRESVTSERDHGGRTLTTKTHRLTRPVASLASDAALCGLYLHEYLQGVDAVRERSNCLRDPKDREQEQVRALVEATYAQLLLALNRIEDAAKHAAIAREMAARSGRGPRKDFGGDSQWTGRGLSRATSTSASRASSPIRDQIEDSSWRHIRKRCEHRSVPTRGRASRIARCR